MNEILTYPDPFLKKEAIIVNDIQSTIVQNEIELMNNVLKDVGGLGLASIQVGMIDSIILYREHGQPLEDLNVLINGKISSILDTNLQRSEEGCFSLPEVFIPIRRYKKIEVVGLNRLGEKVKIEADGMLSNVLQHEIDHVNGMLMIDRLSRLQKRLFKKKLKGLKFNIKV